MNAPLYTPAILRLAADLEPLCALDRPDGEASLRAPTCGSTVKAVVTVDDGVLSALSQDVKACAFGQASAALLQRSAKGADSASIDAAVERIADWLGGKGDSEPWPGMAALGAARSRPARHGAILLPFRALAAAMTDAAR